MTGSADMEPCLVFRADLPEGTIELGFSELPAAAFDSVSATLELNKHEELIQSLENWLGVGLDFSYGAYSIVSPPLFSITPQTQPLNIAVSLPAHTWVYRQGDFPVIDNNSYRITWPTHHATLELTTVDLSDADRQKLEPESLLLLPKSFNNEWAVDLVIPALKYRQSGLLVKDPFSWQGLLAFPQPDSSADAQPSESGAENVGCYFELSTELLLASGNELNTYVNDRLTGSACVVNTTENKKYTGHMIPVGNGFGMRVEHALF
ncbi:MAG: hypothetical protein AAF404_21060 [Pseudomonadota bacterium]